MRMIQRPMNLDSRDCDDLCNQSPHQARTHFSRWERFKATTGQRHAHDPTLLLCWALNCGMTSKDISDLHPAQVDLDRGTITRKRSKTHEWANVPVVQYRLWAETIRLLRNP